MARDPLQPLPASEFGFRHAQHLLNRAGFGGTPGQVRAIANLGLDAAVDYIVNYDKVDAPPVQADQFDADIVRPANEEERREVREARRRGDEATLERFRMEVQQRQRRDRQQIREVQRWWFKRLIESPRPLEEKLTLFWHGHFATSYRGTEDSYHMFLQNQLFRAHAAGNFAALVFGIIRDPAMLRYLNNNRNRRQAPNENLARELMELFTLGEGNVYTEHDIKDGARALTGYTFDDDAFTFRDQWHDRGRKTILGQTGNFDGDDFVRLILSKPIVSEFICHKLYRFFVNDMPGDPGSDGQQFIVRLARIMREHEYELRPVLLALFRSAHFYNERNMASLIKSPVQLVVQAIRSLRTPVRNMDTLIEATNLMGQQLFYPPSVKGWDGGRAWINTSTLFIRQNIVLYLLTGQRPSGYEWDADGARFDAAPLIEGLREGGSAPAPDETVLYLLRFCLGAEPHPDRIRELNAFLQKNGSRIDHNMLVGLLALIAAMPEYQLC